MPIIKKTQQLEKEKGFALLITLVVVTVLISIGLSVLDLSIKQVRLATNAKDSEIAFHAANAGLECALYQRRTSEDAMELGVSFTASCFAQAPVPAIGTKITSGVSGGDVYQYKYQFTWGTSPDIRCSQINTVVGSSSASSALTISGLTTGAAPLVPGYPDGNTKVCEAGTKCSIISVQGFNQPCANVGSYGTVQREVLLQL